MIDVTTSDGKYRYVQDDKGQVIVYRNGEPWFSSGVEHNNLLRAFAQDLAVARNELPALREAVKALMPLTNWVSGALNCKSWEWDWDQRVAASADLLVANAAARALQSHSTGDDK